MAYATLMMIGGTLLINGLVVLGKVDPKGAAPYNIFTGLLATAVPFYLLSNVPGADRASFDMVLGIAPMWLFALTFLWVGINALTEHSPSGVGWYCLWVVGLAVTFAFVSFLRFDAVREGIIWLNWGYLWGLFWVMLALGRDTVAPFTGWAAVMMSIWSVTLQAVLNMLGVWTDVPEWVFVAATVGTIVASLALARGALAARGDALRDPQVSPATS